MWHIFKHLKHRISAILAVRASQRLQWEADKLHEHCTDIVRKKSMRLHLETVTSCDVTAAKTPPTCCGCILKRTKFRPQEAREVGREWLPRRPDDEVDELLDHRFPTVDGEAAAGAGASGRMYNTRARGNLTNSSSSFPQIPPSALNSPNQHYPTPTPAANHPPEFRPGSPRSARPPATRSSDGMLAASRGARPAGSAAGASGSLPKGGGGWGGARCRGGGTGGVGGARRLRRDGEVGK